MHRIKKIEKIAVIGAGQMGAAIACHCANAGFQTLLLDRAPESLTDREKKQGKTLDDTAVKNRIVKSSLKKAIQSKPSPLYLSKFKNRIETGNLKEDLEDIADCDWILEVVSEDFAIKQELYRKIDAHRKPGTPVTTNTSGFAIEKLAEGQSVDFQRCFLGTHFFNPPRYLRLIEIIPHGKTLDYFPAFFQNFFEKYLGKKAVLAEDTPAFIANRLATFSFMNTVNAMQALNLSIEEVDALTGELLGRPKSATFRTADLVGLDTLTGVSAYLRQELPDSDFHRHFEVPELLTKMLKAGLLGQKTNFQGFYKKDKDAAGKTRISTLDTSTLKYRSFKKAAIETLREIDKTDSLEKRLRDILKAEGKAGDFLRTTTANLLAYASHCLGEITDEIYQIDEAMKAGFAWELGPFEIWDTIGLQEGINLIESEGLKPASWVYAMKEHKRSGFYNTKENTSFYYAWAKETYEKTPGQTDRIYLKSFQEKSYVYKNPGIQAVDIGDGIVNVEFKSKMNIFNQDVLDGLRDIFDLAEEHYRGLTFYNRGKNFSVGADLKAIHEMASSHNFDELDDAISYFQHTMMRMRYSSIPTVAAPHQMTLGGGCELCLHADQVVAQTELYMGLVEFGIGLIPGGGGTKEIARRTANSFKKGDVELNRLRERFLKIATAKVSTSAHEALANDLIDVSNPICIQRDRQLKIAKTQALLLAENAYVKPIPQADIKVLGQQALGAFYIGTHQMRAGNFISDHDRKIANKLAYVIAGGELSEPAYVSEEYLLSLEREAFLSLAGEPKTQARMKAMLETGKPLRN